MTSDAKQSVNIATRVDTWIHNRRKNRAIKKGKIPTMVPAICYGKSGWVRILGRVLYLKGEMPAHLKLRKATDIAAKIRGWKSFASVFAPNEQVNVHYEDQLLGTVTADNGGVIDAKLAVELSPGWHTLRFTTERGKATEAPVYVIYPDAKIGIISDIDDTVLNTMMPRPFLAAWHSFVANQNSRTATPGMPVLLDHLTTYHNGPILYLSTGAWNVAPTLSRFLERQLYPLGPMLLTDWGPTHDRWFRDGQAHKRKELARLIGDFPNMKWILIGDDGQHDEEIYREFSESNPDHIAAVVIRQLSTGEAMLAGGRSQSEKHEKVSGVPWIYGYDGAQIWAQLTEIGLLPEHTLRLR